MAESGLNSSIDGDCSCTDINVSSVLLFSLPLLLFLVNFIDEKHVSFFTEVGGRLLNKSKTHSTLSTSLFLNAVWTSSKSTSFMSDPNLQNIKLSYQHWRNISKAGMTKELVSFNTPQIIKNDMRRI